MLFCHAIVMVRNSYIYINCYISIILMILGWRHLNFACINNYDWLSPGQMVDKLREHLNTYLPQLGKKKIEMLVVNYMAKLVCVCSHISQENP